MSRYAGRLYIEPSDLFSMDFALQIATNHRNGPAQKGTLDLTPDPRELAQDFPQIWELDATFASATIEYDFGDYVFKVGIELSRRYTRPQT